MKKIEYRSLSEILKLENSDGLELSYNLLLSTTEWKLFRDKIIRRDSFQCQMCGERANELAWWISGPFEIYVRPATEIEKEYSAEDVIYATEHILLNVHHKYYIRGKFPWQYREDALITLCESCHIKIHDNEDIIVYENDKLEVSRTIPKCLKCKGTGYISKFHHYFEGICFQCNGKGTLY